MPTINYRKGTVLFAAASSEPDMIEAAKKYCRENGYTQDDVVIVIVNKAVQVQARRNLSITDGAVQHITQSGSSDARPSSPQQNAAGHQ